MKFREINLVLVYSIVWITISIAASSDLHKQIESDTYFVECIILRSSLRGKQFPPDLTRELCLKIQLLQFSISELMARYTYLAIKLNCSYVSLWESQWKVAQGVVMNKLLKYSFVCPDWLHWMKYFSELLWLCLMFCFSEATEYTFHIVI